jgi:predicted N-acetyltransferase YhbS
MKRMELEIRAPREKQDTEEMFDLIAKAFSRGPGYFGALEFLGEKYIRNGMYDWDASRIGLIDGRMVTHFGVWGYTMRIGVSRVRVGGIGAVATHGHFRRLGLMADTTRASIDAMRELGYDLSILFGLDKFYHKYGYVRAWSSTVYVVRTADLPTEKPESRMTEFALGHRQDIADLYNREYSICTGTAVRPTYIRNRWSGMTGYLWKNGSREVKGYVVLNANEDRFDVVETCGDVDQILRAVAHLARRGGYREVRFPNLPYNSQVCKQIRRGNSRVEIGNRLSGGPMIRTIDLASTLTKMTDEFSRRLKGSLLSGWCGKLRIEDGREEAALAIDRSRVGVCGPEKTKHSISGGNEIASLLIGTDEPEETVEAGNMKLTGEAKTLVPVLFPNEHPVLHTRDDY